MASPPITKPLENIDSKKIRIIGVPLDLGQSRRGVDMGPSAVRVAGLESKLEALGYVVEDKGNVPVALAETKSEGDPNAKYLKEIAETCSKEADWSCRRSRRARFPSCWVATTPSRRERFRALPSSIAARNSASACCGSTRTPTSTLPKALPAATCTACRWAPSWGCSPARSPTCTGSVRR